MHRPKGARRDATKEEVYFQLLVQAHGFPPDFVDTLLEDSRFTSSRVSWSI